MLQRPFTLKVRLTFLFGAFAVALLAVYGSFVDQIASTRLLQAQERQLAQASRQMALRLDQDMLSHFREISVTASGMILQSNLPNEEKQRLLERIQSKLPDYAWIGLTDTEGRIVAATNDLLEGVDVSKRDWFVAGRVAPSALDLHQAYLLQQHLAPNATVPLRFVDLVAPVHDSQRRLVGVLSGHLSWDWADRIRRSILSAETGLDEMELLVVSKSGEIILGPSHRMGQNFDVASVQSQLRSMPAIAVYRSSHFVTAIHKTTGMAEYPGLGWTVVAQLPFDAAMAPASEVRGAMLWGSALIAFLFMLLGLAISQFVARPLGKLAAAAGALRDDPHAPIPVTKSYREASALAEALKTSIEAQRQREVELRDLNDHLEQQIAARTGELEEAKNRAEAATAAKAEFLATMSHEVRTPLGSILGFADLLLEDRTLDAEQRRRLQLIQSSGSLLTSIINDILDFSKIEAGKVVIVESLFGLSALVEGCAALVAPAAEAKGLRLDVEIAAGVEGSYLGDEMRIRQVLLNLLGNAVKFTKAGRIHISVVELKREGEDRNLSFAVSDTGIGIPADKIGGLFERFSQVDSSIERQFGGTGLGLAISQRLAQLMGGGVTVRSIEGEGSTFSVQIPLKAAAPGSVVLPADSVRGGAGLRILLVEDVEANREIATTMLASAGHSVMGVGDGPAAIAAAMRERFDVILMDVQMPGMNGVEATRAIRQLGSHNATVTIVALTANVLPEQVAAYRAAGMDAHIGKPIQRSALLAQIASVGTTRPRPRDGETAAGDALSLEVYSEITELLGPERAAVYMNDLATELAEFPEFARDNPGQAVAEAAHKLAGLAGTLGFLGLSARCKMLDQAIERNDPGMSQAHDELIAAIPSVLRALSVLPKPSNSRRHASQGEPG